MLLLLRSLFTMHNIAFSTSRLLRHFTCKVCDRAIINVWCLFALQFSFSFLVNFPVSVVCYIYTHTQTDHRQKIYIYIPIRFLPPWHNQNSTAPTSNAKNYTPGYSIHWVDFLYIPYIKISSLTDISGKIKSKKMEVLLC